MELQVKRCTRCKQEKPLDAANFPLHNKTKSGFDSWCRACRATYRSEINRGVFRGVISDEALKEVKATTKECVICGTETALVVDHDHCSGKVRGMLCGHCNRGLGHFRDDPELLEFARQYLMASSEDPAMNAVWRKYQESPVAEEEHF